MMNDGMTRGGKRWGRMAGWMPLLAAMALLPACAAKGPGVQEVGAVETAPVYEPPLLPEDLVGRLGFENFEEARSGGGASVSVTVLNLSGIDPVTVQLCARFSDDRGQTLFDTAWTTVTIPAANRHQFHAETTERGAAAGRILLRRVLPAGTTN